MPVDLNYAPPQPTRRFILRWRTVVILIAGSALLIALLAIVLQWTDRTRSVRRSVQSRLESAVRSGAISFDFGADQSFMWDRMHVFEPYSDQSTVERRLGFQWPDFDQTTIASDDGVALVVFVRQQRVVGWYEQPRSIDLCWLSNDAGHPRGEAVFQITPTSDGRFDLKPFPASRPPTTRQ